MNEIFVLFFILLSMKGKGSHDTILSCVNFSIYLFSAISINAGAVDFVGELLNVAVVNRGDVN